MQIVINEESILDAIEKGIQWTGVNASKKLSQLAGMAELKATDSKGKALWLFAATVTGLQLATLAIVYAVILFLLLGFMAGCLVGDWYFSAGHKQIKAFIIDSEAKQNAIGVKIGKAIGYSILWVTNELLETIGVIFLGV